MSLSIFIVSGPQAGVDKKRIPQNCLKIKRVETVLPGEKDTAPEKLFSRGGAEDAERTRPEPMSPDRETT
jgi:hypothetical protein